MDLQTFYTRKILFSKSAFSYFKNISSHFQQLQAYMSYQNSLYVLLRLNLFVFEGNEW